MVSRVNRVIRAFLMFKCLPTYFQNLFYTFKARSYGVLQETRPSSFFLLFQRDFYRINGTYYAPAFTITTPTLLRTQVTDRSDKCITPCWPRTRLFSNWLVLKRIVVCASFLMVWMSFHKIYSWIMEKLRTCYLTYLSKEVRWKGFQILFHNISRWYLPIILTRNVCKTGYSLYSAQIELSLIYMTLRKGQFMMSAKCSTFENKL